MRLNYSVARILNAYWPKESPYSPHVIADFFLKAYEILRIRTNHFEIIGDSDQIRSFIYLSDIVRGLVSPAENDKVYIVNLGSDRGFTS